MGRFVGEARDRLTAKLREWGESFLEHNEPRRARDVWKRDLAGRANGAIDPWYQWDLYSEMVDYAIDFPFPWCAFPFFCPSWFQSPITLSLALGREFDFYDIPDALSPEAVVDASIFHNGSSVSHGCFG